MDNKDFLIEQYVKQNAELTALVNTQNEIIRQLQETIKELQRQLNQNSRNSSNRLPVMDSISRNSRASGKHPAENRADKRDIPDLICLFHMNRMRSKSICQSGACPVRI